MGGEHTANMSNILMSIPRSLLIWKGDSPRRLVEGDGTNVEFLNLVDRADGQGAVVGQSQTVGGNKKIIINRVSLVFKP